MYYLIVFILYKCKSDDQIQDHCQCSTAKCVFLMCDVCKADPDKCGTAGCTCGKQRKTNADGSEGAETSKRACNYEAVKVNASGSAIGIQIAKVPQEDPVANAMIAEMMKIIAGSIAGVRKLSLKDTI